jgi:uncharacterized cysteine cluster protein YcgN (CxxCxxCC family)
MHPLMDEHDELKARPTLLGTCKSCSSLPSKLAEKVAKLSSFEKANSDSIVVKCIKCEAFELEVASCRHEKMRIEEENTYLQSILS